MIGKEDSQRGRQNWRSEHLRAGEASAPTSTAAAAAGVLPGIKEAAPVVVFDAAVDRGALVVSRFLSLVCAPTLAALVGLLPALAAGSVAARREGGATLLAEGRDRLDGAWKCVCVCLCVCVCD